MDALRKLLEELKRHVAQPGCTLGLFRLLIGRRIEKADGTKVCSGLTWRELAVLLKKVRWPPEAVRDLGLDPSLLPPRDRQQFWYNAISKAHVDSAAAHQAGDVVTALLESLGYKVIP